MSWKAFHFPKKLRLEYRRSTGGWVSSFLAIRLFAVGACGWSWSAFVPSPAKLDSLLSTATQAKRYPPSAFV